MSGVTHVEIRESTEELQALLRAEKQPSAKERLQALYLIRAEQFTVSAAARVLGKHRGTLQRWLARYHQGGLPQMLARSISPGRPRVIPDWAVRCLQKQLQDPEGGFERYTQIQQWLRTQLGVEADYATVHHLVR
ncbi:helix-turn-helix domain-containing protein, partial [Rubidibacter lacunae]|uniref:helix-turn-helix domain-containing protein n=1 Tax=Rubidibacter lacunae TaxID=582514 RepID=UPI0004110877